MEKYIIAFCPDTLSWFVSKEEFEQIFDNINEAIDYFKIWKDIFLNKTIEIMRVCGQKYERKEVYLENTESWY